MVFQHPLKKYRIVEHFSIGYQRSFKNGKARLFSMERDKGVRQILLSKNDNSLNRISHIHILIFEKATKSTYLSQPDTKDWNLS